MEGGSGIQGRRIMERGELGIGMLLGGSLDESLCHF
jgi:hypothetical protein